MTSQQLNTQPPTPTAGARWAIRNADLRGAVELAKGLLCPLPIAKLLVSRGISDHAEAQAFFQPSIDDLHNPMLLCGMTEAVLRIQQAVAAAEPILIYGDYDVDGTTATVLLKTAIERTAPANSPARVTYHVPHRIREGYGMQTNILGDAAAAGIRLVISVDTGIRAFAAAIEAKALGLDLIVTDHHLPDIAAGIPDALSVINPAQSTCLYPFKFLCGAAVAFKLAHALLAAAAVTAPEQLRLRTVLLPSFLKLVAIATIADSVPLIGENRVIATLGLRELRNPVQPGLRALMEVAQIPFNRPPTATEIGFRLAPRINAAGRMDIASDVVELFLTRDPQRAATLAARLDALNNDRRATEAEALTAIEATLENIKKDIKSSSGEYPAECVILDDPGWHRGVLGILASRVVDRTSRPALIMTHDDGQAHGSGRSIEGFHLLDALTAIHQPSDMAPAGDAETSSLPLFTRFGGHAHAAGFSLPSGNLTLLRERMKAYAADRLLGPMRAPRTILDMELLLSEISDELYEWLQRCAPFGNSHAEPLFTSRNVRLCAAPRIIQQRHVCLQFYRDSGSALSALGWSREFAWPARCAELSLGQGSVVDIAYRIRQNTHAQYGGIELELSDICLAAE